MVHNVSASTGSAHRQAAPLANGNAAGGQQQAAPVQQEQLQAVVKAEIPQKPPMQPQPFAPPQHTGLQQPQHVQQPPAPQACSLLTTIKCSVALTLCQARHSTCLTFYEMCLFLLSVRCSRP